MPKFHLVALANTFAILDIIANILLSLWLYLSPSSYAETLHMVIAGLQMEVQPAVDLNLANFFSGAVIEAAVFWVLGASIATVYNRLTPAA